VLGDEDAVERVTVVAGKTSGVKHLVGRNVE
jgi:hypothetical protein